MADKTKADEKQETKQNACLYCGAQNDEGAVRCGVCGINFKVGSE